VPLAASRRAFPFRTRKLAATTTLRQRNPAKSRLALLQTTSASRSSLQWLTQFVPGANIITDEFSTYAFCSPCDCYSETPARQRRRQGGTVRADVGSAKPALQKAPEVLNTACVDVAIDVLNCVVHADEYSREIGMRMTSHGSQRA